MIGKEHLRVLGSRRDLPTYELRLKTPNINKLVRKLADNYDTLEITAVAIINPDGTRTLL